MESDELGVQVALLEGVLAATTDYTAARGVSTVCIGPVEERGVRWDGVRLRPRSDEAGPAARRLVGLIRIAYREVVPFHECERGGEGGWSVFHEDGAPAVLAYTGRWEYVTDERVEASAVLERSRRDRLRFACRMDRAGRAWRVDTCTCSSETPGACERIRRIY